MPAPKWSVADQQLRRIEDWVRTVPAEPVARERFLSLLLAARKEIPRMKLTPVKQP